MMMNVAKLTRHSNGTIIGNDGHVLGGIESRDSVSCDPAASGGNDHATDGDGDCHSRYLTEDGDDDDDEQAQATVMSGNTKAPKTIYKCRYCYRHCRGIPALRTHMHKVHNLWSKYSLPVIVDCEN